MDPEATLSEAEDSFSEGSFEDSAYSLSVYFRWRIEQGFEPHLGDNRATILLAKLGKRCDKYAKPAELTS